MPSKRHLPGKPVPSAHEPGTLRVLRRDGTALDISDDEARAALDRRQSQAQATATTKRLHELLQQTLSNGQDDRTSAGLADALGAGGSRFDPTLPTAGFGVRAQHPQEPTVSPVQRLQDQLMGETDPARRAQLVAQLTALLRPQPSQG